MSDIKRARELYSKMADRFSQSGFAPRQARTYRELADFIKDCPSAQAAADKIKDSPYQLGLGAALLQDKLAALERASAEQGLEDVAAVYREKIEAISKDVQAMYETGYEARARSLKTPYLTTLEAFSDAFDSYLALAAANAADAQAGPRALEELKQALARLEKPSDDPRVLADLPPFRTLLPLGDPGCQRFIEEVTAVASLQASLEAEQAELTAEVQALQAALTGQEEALKQAGQATAALMGRANALALAPDHTGGCYSYQEEVVHRE